MQKKSNPQLGVILTDSDLEGFICGRIDQGRNVVEHVKCHVDNLDGVLVVFLGQAAHDHVCVTDGLDLSEFQLKHVF